MAAQRRPGLATRLYRWIKSSGKKKESRISVKLSNNRISVSANSEIDDDTLQDTVDSFREDVDRIKIKGKAPRHSPRVKELELQDVLVDDCTLTEGLKTLRLKGVIVSVTPRLTNFILSCSTITTLDMSSVPQMNDELLYKVIEHNDILEELRLSRMAVFTAEGLKKALRLSKLQKIALENVGVSVLERGTFPYTLRDLTLIGTHSLCNVCITLTNPEGLESLELVSCLLSPKEFKYDIDALTGLKRLMVREALQLSNYSFEKT